MSRAVLALALTLPSILADEPACPATVDLPTVNLSAPTSAADAAAACEAHGLFHVLAPALFSGEDATAAFQAHARTFSLAEADKHAVAVQRRGGFVRGFVPLGRESGTAERFECKEGFSYGWPWNSTVEPANALQGNNVWPAVLGEQSRDALMRVFEQFAAVSEAVVHRLLGEALSMSTHDLDGITQGGETISVMRLFHYFAQDHAPCRAAAAPTVERVGSSPHTDWGLLTLILDDGSAGLQVKAKHDPDGPWRSLAAPAAPGTLLAICGDYLSLTSGHRFHSPVHRVQLLPQERSSFVFFFYPNFQSQLTPVHGRSSAAAEDQVAQLQAGHGPKHNTLMDLAAAKPDLLTMPFGEYIMSKWDGVFRDRSPEA